MFSIKKQNIPCAGSAQYESLTSFPTIRFRSWTWSRCEIEPGDKGNSFKIIIGTITYNYDELMNLLTLEPVLIGKGTSRILRP